MTDTTPTEVTDSEQTLVRKEKRQRLLDAGSQVYPADLSRSHTLSEIRANEAWNALEIGEEALAAWKSDVDLGDFVWVQGRVIRSKRGELSIMANQWRMASKALRPLPVLHKDLSEEARVRRRYVDLIVRDEAREMVRKRSAITRAIRDTLYGQGYREVETPILQLVHGGASARR